MSPAQEIPTDKYERLRQNLGQLGSVVVAFSGGLDSTVLLRVAVDVLGPERVLAATGRSPSVPAEELNQVTALAAECGAPHVFVDTGEFEDPEYLANPANRCYFCKMELYRHLTRLARERGLAAVVCGANADDLGDFRPGLDAGKNLGVHAPLVDAGLNKTELRALAAVLGLSVHDKPASPCLSSRVPYGEPITPEKLAQIDAAERFLRELGFRVCRVRHHGQVARIEVPPDQIEKLAATNVRSLVEKRLRELGFRYVALDMRGFRSGSLNEVLLGPNLQSRSVS